MGLYRDEGQHKEDSLNNRLSKYTTLSEICNSNNFNNKINFMSFSSNTRILKIIGIKIFYARHQLPVIRCPNPQIMNNNKK